MNRLPDFIFIDDEEINIMICRFTVEAVLGKETRTQSFTNPLNALQYLRSFQRRSPEVSTILLLDLNMPMMTGWEFLEAFDCLPAPIKQAFRIYILSSSLDIRDRQRSYANKNVIDFLLKPLGLDSVSHIARAAMEDTCCS